jgi:hypothetical protein
VKRIISPSPQRVRERPIRKGAPLTDTPLINNKILIAFFYTDVTSQSLTLIVNELKLGSSTPLCFI